MEDEDASSSTSNDGGGGGEEKEDKTMQQQQQQQQQQGQRRRRRQVVVGIGQRKEHEIDCRRHYHIHCPFDWIRSGQRYTISHGKPENCFSQAVTQGPPYIHSHHYHSHSNNNNKKQEKNWVVNVVWDWGHLYESAISCHRFVNWTTSYRSSRSSTRQYKQQKQQQRQQQRQFHIDLVDTDGGDNDEDNDKDNETRNNKNNKHQTNYDHQDDDDDDDYNNNDDDGSDNNNNDNDDKEEENQNEMVVQMNPKRPPPRRPPPRPLLQATVGQDHCFEPRIPLVIAKYQKKDNKKNKDSQNHHHHHDDNDNHDNFSVCMAISESPSELTNPSCFSSCNDSITHVVHSYHHNKHNNKHKNNHNRHADNNMEWENNNNHKDDDTDDEEDTHFLYDDGEEGETQTQTTMEPTSLLSSLYSRDHDHHSVVGLGPYGWIQAGKRYNVYQINDETTKTTTTKKTTTKKTLVQANTLCRPYLVTKKNGTGDGIVVVGDGEVVDDDKNKNKNNKNKDHQEDEKEGCTTLLDSTTTTTMEWVIDVLWDGCQPEGGVPCRYFVPMDSGTKKTTMTTSHGRPSNGHPIRHCRINTTTTTSRTEKSSISFPFRQQQQQQRPPQEAQQQQQQQEAQQQLLLPPPQEQEQEKPRQQEQDKNRINEQPGYVQRQRHDTQRQKQQQQQHSMLLPPSSPKRRRGRMIARKIQLKEWTNPNVTTHVGVSSQQRTRLENNDDKTISLPLGDMDQEQQQEQQEEEEEEDDEEEESNSFRSSFRAMTKMPTISSKEARTALQKVGRPYGIQEAMNEARLERARNKAQEDLIPLDLHMRVRRRILSSSLSLSSSKDGTRRTRRKRRKRTREQIGEIIGEAREGIVVDGRGCDDVVVDDHEILDDNNHPQRVALWPVRFEFDNDNEEEECQEEIVLMEYTDIVNHLISPTDEHPSKRGPPLKRMLQCLEFCGVGTCLFVCLCVYLFAKWWLIFVCACVCALMLFGLPFVLWQSLCICPPLPPPGAHPPFVILFLNFCLRQLHDVVPTFGLCSSSSECVRWTFLFLFFWNIGEPVASVQCCRQGGWRMELLYISNQHNDNKKKDQILQIQPKHDFSRVPDFIWISQPSSLEPDIISKLADILRWALVSLGTTMTKKLKSAIFRTCSWGLVLLFLLLLVVVCLFVLLAVFFVLTQISIYIYIYAFPLLLLPQSKHAHLIVAIQTQQEEQIEERLPQQFQDMWPRLEKVQGTHVWTNDLDLRTQLGKFAATRLSSSLSSSLSCNNNNPKEKEESLLVVQFAAHFVNAILVGKRVRWSPASAP